MDPQDAASADEPDATDLVPCVWRICDFAFQRSVRRWDVVIPADTAYPIIEQGFCVVPGCGKYLSNPEGADEDRQLSPNYHLSTEVASIEEHVRRQNERFENEDRLREAAAKEDEHVVQLEVAGTVVSLTKREAALVVYCPEEWAGAEIRVKKYPLIWLSDRLRMSFEHSTTVIGRPLGDRTVYAAVFPRIQPISYTGWHEGLRNTGCEISARRGSNRYEGHYELFLGNVTEVDWTNREPLPSAWLPKSTKP